MNMSSLIILILKVLLKDCVFVLLEALNVKKDSFGVITQ